jgi:serine/threonine protein kinase
MPEEPLPLYRLEFKSFRDWNGDRPSQTLIFHNNGSLWWIKVTVDWSLPTQVLALGYLKRRSIFQEFLEAIDFGQLQLLDDTVTNITLSLTEQSQTSTGQSQNSIMLREGHGHQDPANFFIAIAYQICYKIAEDPKRVMYPTYPTLERDRCLPIFEAGCLQTIDVIAPTVSKVMFEQHIFAYKTIDRPIYEPEDTEHMLNEIDVLTQFRGLPSIAQLVGLVVSENPYKTCPSTDMPIVITGFLLEYYSGGSLEQIFEDESQFESQFDTLLIQWALQIGIALRLLHKRGRTHLDIKPSNIVLDANEHAVLIDVSGTGGYVWEWLSPEMQILIQNIETSPANTPFEARVATDCWAYGRLLSALAERSGTPWIGKKLQFIADGLTKAAPELRISLCDALSRLDEKA